MRERRCATFRWRQRGINTIRGDGMLSEQLRDLGLDDEAKRAEQLERAVEDLADRLGMVRFALAAACSVLDGAGEPDHLDDHAGGPVGQAAV